MRSNRFGAGAVALAEAGVAFARGCGCGCGCGQNVAIALGLKAVSPEAYFLGVRPKVGPDQLRSRKACRVIDRCPEGHRGHRTDPGYGHQQPAHRVRLHHCQHEPTQLVEALEELPADPENWTDHLFEQLVATDELAHALLEGPWSTLPIFRPKALRTPRR